MSTIFTVAHPSLIARDFTQVRNEIIENLELSGLARLLLIYLVSKAHLSHWKFYDDQIRKVVGCGITKLKFLFKELRDAGYVRVVSLQNPSGYFIGSQREFSDQKIFLKQLPEESVVVEYQELTESMESILSEEYMATPRRVWNTHCPESILSCNNTDLVNNTDTVLDKKINKKDFGENEGKSNSPPQSKSKSLGCEKKSSKKHIPVKISDTEMEEEFERFWSQYPRTDGKQDAKKAFKKIFHGLDRDEAKNLLMEIFDGLMSLMVQRAFHEKALLTYKKHSQLFWIAPWKHCSTWLNGKCWLDGKECSRTYDEFLQKIARDNPGFKYGPQGVSSPHIFYGQAAQGGV